MSGNGSSDRAPIGVFDSGVGGLTVVAALLREYPAERILYVADQAHVPYGGRPLDEVRAFAVGISRFLAAEGCRAVLMACNISSAVAVDAAREALPHVPVLGVIEPAARFAAVNSAASAGPIGVLATEGTVRSGAYPRAIAACAPDVRVVQRACPRFVPLVETGRTESAEAIAAATEYLSPLAEAGCATVVLGCTHYPFLLYALRAAARDLFPESRGVPGFIDPAALAGPALASMLPDLGSRSSEERRPRPEHLLLTTGNPDTLECQIPRFLPGVAARVAAAHWTSAPDGALALRAGVGLLAAAS